MEQQDVRRNYDAQVSEPVKSSERISENAPQFTAAAVRRVLTTAIAGVGPFPGAAQMADRIHDANHGDEIASVKELMDTHVRLAAAQGLVTNLGGLVTAAMAIPANLAGMAFLQIRLTAGIMHLRGYDLYDARVQNAILAALLGEAKILELLREAKVPTTPMAIATAPMEDPKLGVVLANEVAAELVTRVGGKRLATTVARRTPLVGGFFGAGTDAYWTWQAGRYADREFLSRKRR
jgi:hypothetical protein